MAGKKDVILNFFEQLMQIAMSQEIYLETQRTKLICQGARCSIIQETSPERQSALLSAQLLMT